MLFFPNSWGSALGWSMGRSTIPTKAGEPKKVPDVIKKKSELGRSKLD